MPANFYLIVSPPQTPYRGQTAEPDVLPTGYSWLGCFMNMPSIAYHQSTGLARGGLPAPGWEGGGLNSVRAKIKENHWCTPPQGGGVFEVQADSTSHS